MLHDDSFLVLRNDLVLNSWEPVLAFFALLCNCGPARPHHFCNLLTDTVNPETDGGGLCGRILKY